ncbi:hypothetical protein GGR56DRAFT_639824 [Xylariaceae sp. FL0804]|nr:hypothetical protein GGR56DRAFT_639824 [Xylariaceae sp. FL0804]
MDGWPAGLWRGSGVLPQPARRHGLGERGKESGSGREWGKNANDGKPTIFDMAPMIITFVTITTTFTTFAASSLFSSLPVSCLIPHLMQPFIPHTSYHTHTHTTRIHIHTSHILTYPPIYIHIPGLDVWFHRDSLWNSTQHTRADARTCG